ncbi:MAG: SRPBCC family protein [Methylococcaceae bacterium]
MPQFSLTTIWLIPAPVEIVWNCLVDTETWPTWWRYVVAVKEMTKGRQGIGNARKYHWRTCLPYNLMLILRVTDVQLYQQIAVEVTGDLKGDGCCRLVYLPESAHTRIEFTWRVQTCKPWMDWFASLSTPVFAWNHARVMKFGEQSLIQHLTNSKVINNGE